VKHDSYNTWRTKRETPVLAASRKRHASMVGLETFTSADDLLKAGLPEGTLVSAWSWVPVDGDAKLSPDCDYVLQNGRLEPLP
jgi:hypothetical protein